MKIEITKGKYKGIRGRVVGVYTDGRYDINVIKSKPTQPSQPKIPTQMVIKINNCKEI
jgi:ribosomal protein L24